jgi:hypothetical protein
MSSPDRPDDPTVIVRLHTGSDGRSHFEELRLDLEPRSTENPAVTILESRGIGVERIILSHISHRDSSGQMHTVPQRQLVVHLAGVTEIEASGGETRRFGRGSVLLAEDLTGAGHATRGVGHEPRVALFVHLRDDERL